MGDVMEISGRDRRAIRKMVARIVERREERERMRWAISRLFFAHKHEKRYGRV